eukprot:CAMPEP_0171963372 /NCGR_PEP_ID=MMETSP0993-20121228/175105_1 /TAXON_ID=483369 /ORGANISM="non described non described, Strain CCMP2098" /LENGTH=210 /DNA_ID=CAMNT_0012611937 /DNA_START=28 /DNA_END=657 /DNA_ORIENTATION=-
MEDDEQQGSEAATAAATLIGAEEGAEDPPSQLTASHLVKIWSHIQPVTPSDLAALAAPRQSGEGEGEFGEEAPAGVTAAVGRLQTHPFDTEAWRVLVEESKAHRWRRREALTAATRQFPSSGSCWVDLIDYELTRASVDVGRVDSAWLKAMQLTGYAYLDLWVVKLQRALETYSSESSEQRAASSEQRQSNSDSVERARRARDDAVRQFD